MNQQAHPWACTQKKSLSEKIPFSSGWLVGSPHVWSSGGHSRRKTDIWLLWQQWGLELPSFEPATKGTFFLLEVILLAGA